MDKNCAPESSAIIRILTSLSVFLLIAAISIAVHELEATDFVRYAFECLIGTCSLQIVKGYTMYWAESYPVVWRYSMFMNAPNSLVLVSMLATFTIIFLLNKRGTWASKDGNNSGQGCGAYFVLGVPLVLGLTQLGLFINGVADKSQTEAFRTAVVGKRISRFTKGPPRWYVDVADWRHRGYTVQISVPEWQYEKMELGSTMRILTKRGFLGYEWMVSYLASRSSESWAGSG